MISKLKFFISLMGLFFFFFTAISGVGAHPMANLGPEDSLYQRVKKLGDYGLLDPQDKAVLDSGQYVTRMELAFYTQKAKARIEAPELGTPVPTSTPVPSPTATPIVTSTPTSTATPSIDPALRKMIDDLLKELHADSAALKNTWASEDARLKDRQKEIDKLAVIQEDLNAQFKRMNNKVLEPTINSSSSFHFETIDLNGPRLAAGPVTFTAAQNVMRSGMGTDITITTILNGVGTFSMGLNGGMEFGGAYTVGAAGTDFDFQLEGPLGSWIGHVMEEGYPAAMSLGDFTRGLATAGELRYKNPFNIVHYTSDKDGKLWFDYMTNLDPVPVDLSSGFTVSSTDNQFSGIYGVGNDLPLLGGDGRITLMAGRPSGLANIWEEGAKFDVTLVPGFRMEFSTYWENNNSEKAFAAPELDLKSHQILFNYFLDPLQITVEAGLSSLYTGIHDMGPRYPVGLPTLDALEGPAGQVHVTFYPLDFYYEGISESFSNFNSKVLMGGLHLDQYGIPVGYSAGMDFYGYLGEVSTMINDRSGWRASFGWKGRQERWLKNLPSFLDDFLLSADLAQKKEYVAEYNSVGYNVVEVLPLISVYYPDDSSLWDDNFWGGYGTGANAVRSNYMQNTEAIRGDELPGTTIGDTVRAMYRFTSERIPMILPADSNYAPLAPGSTPASHVTLGGSVNNFYVLPNLKSYNYLTLTAKVMFDRILGWKTPLYGAVFFTDNYVAANGASPATFTTSVTNPNPQQFLPANGAKLFDQTVYNFAAMYQIFPKVDLMANYGWETWTSLYSYPLVDRRRDSYGAGLSYDFPWGGGRWDIRVMHYTFTDTYVPLNNFQTNQVYSDLKISF